MPKTAMPNRFDRTRIGVECGGVDERTVRRAYESLPVQPATRKCIEEAAAKLGLPLPPAAQGVTP